MKECAKNECESYVSLDNGAFVFRHIYMDDFEKEFNVKPIHVPIIDPSVSDLLRNHNLTYDLKNDPELNPSAVEDVVQETKNYAHAIEDLKRKVDNGTFVDDGGLYVRWVNEILRYGMFAGREFMEGEMLGVYAGLIVRDSIDNEYAWEYNYLVDVKDRNGKKVEISVDGKNFGNYLRFANHRDCK
ncbi:11695_t:CDS:2 [Acaulospora colombiana]|uniref:11695_t:CDS:1 n=1 Tax=Acaulospora colombiana TaxID=27376 RepID=A0ACA9K5K8_9GLOM|nr:11695_t:CDS:2 [Acaulospora colombiana]